MPFKRGKSPDDMEAKFRKWTNQIKFKRAKRAVTVAQIIILQRAALYVPLQYGALKNSEFREQPKARRGGVRGYIGYTQKYAVPLHSPRIGSKMWRWQPRPVGAPGKPNGGANMRAKQRWMSLAKRQSQRAWRAAMIRELRGL